VEAIFQTLSGWFHNVKTTTIPAEEDTVGMYRADYSPLTEEEMASDPCAELFKNSTPASR
jgi:hypothetical protein